MSRVPSGGIGLRLREPWPPKLAAVRDHELPHQGPPSRRPRGGRRMPAVADEPRPLGRGECMAHTSAVTHPWTCGLAARVPLVLAPAQVWQFCLLPGLAPSIVLPAFLAVDALNCASKSTGPWIFFGGASNSPEPLVQESRAPVQENPSVNLLADKSSGNAGPEFDCLLGSRALLVASGCYVEKLRRYVLPSAVASGRRSRKEVLLMSSCPVGRSS